MRNHLNANQIQLFSSTGPIYRSLYLVKKFISSRFKPNYLFEDRALSKVQHTGHFTDAGGPVLPSSSHHLPSLPQKHWMSWSISHQLPDEGLWVSSNEEKTQSQLQSHHRYSRLCSPCASKAVKNTPPSHKTEQKQTNNTDSLSKNNKSASETGPSTSQIC